MQFLEDLSNRFSHKNWGGGGGGWYQKFWKIEKCWIWRLLMKGINSRQIPYQYSATTAIKVPLSPVAD